MAHKKGGGSTNNGRDSNSKRLGVKRFGGEFCPTLANNNVARDDEFPAETLHTKTF